MALVRQLVGIYLSLVISTLRYRSLILQLPLVALIPAYFALTFGLSAGRLLELMAGAVVSSGVWVSIGLMQDIVYEREVYRYLEMLIASPARPVAYMLAHIAYSYTLSLVSVVPMALIYAWLTGRVDSIAWSLLLSLLLSLALSSMSMAAGLRFRNIREVGALPSLVSTLLVFLPPVYYPAARLPAWLAAPASLIPSASAAEALRGIVQGESFYNPIVLVAYLALLALASTVYVAVRTNWRLE